MDQELLLKEIVEKVVQQMGASSPATTAATSAPRQGTYTAAQYPLGEHVADDIKSPTGRKLSDITLDKVLKGEVGAEDMRIAPETLEMQAQVAESVNREAFAGNLRRASELIAVPDDRLLEIYNALRPYRSTKQELLDIAAELDSAYGARVAASLVREAAEVYERRGRLKKF